MRFRLSRPSVGEARPSLVRMDRCVTKRSRTFIWASPPVQCDEQTAFQSLRSIYIYNIFNQIPGGRMPSLQQCGECSASYLR